MRVFVAALKLIAFLILNIVIVPTQTVILLFTKGALSRPLPLLYMKAVVTIFRIRVHSEGTPYQDQQCLYMSNHLSYLDIPVIGSIISPSFVSKADVANWPIFGYLAQLRQTAFIGRAKADTSAAARTVSAFIERGESLIIFPEGTSTDGRNVLDFKSSLFSLALNEDKPDLHVQPLTVFMASANGNPIKDQDSRDLYAWHRNMDTELPEHLWRFAKGRGAEIYVVFHEALRAQDFEDRKTLAKATHEAVSKGHTELTSRFTT